MGALRRVRGGGAATIASASPRRGQATVSLIASESSTLGSAGRSWMVASEKLAGTKLSFRLMEPSRFVNAVPILCAADRYVQLAADEAKMLRVCMVRTPHC